jgi:hypothetical protein
MEPSAYERAAFDVTMKFNHLGRTDCDSIELNKAIAAAVDAAFRDGAKAERERILKMLREPSEEMLKTLSNVAAHALNKHSSIQDVVRVSATLKAFADALDAGNLT